MKNRKDHRRTQLTVSNPLPLKIRSVVAATLPPFKCKSHIISLWFICGNICDICSTCAGSTLRPRGSCTAAPSRDEKNHRKTKNETTARVRIEGMLSVGSSSAMYAVRVVTVSVALACLARELVQVRVVGDATKRWRRM